MTNKIIKPDEDFLQHIDLDELIERIAPDCEYYHPLYSKFITMVCQDCGSWWEMVDGWKELPECDKWKYVALIYLSKYKNLEYRVDHANAWRTIEDFELQEARRRTKKS
jgi:hypothetical protein